MFVNTSCNPKVEGDPSRILGKWNTTGKRTVLEFYENGETIEAKIVQMKRGKDKEGKLILDRQNPLKNERSKALLGKMVVKNLKFAGGLQYKNGEYYNYSNGKTYKVSFTVNDKDNCLDVLLELDGKQFKRSWQKNSNSYK